MVKIKNSVAGRRRKKKMVKAASGHRGHRHKRFRQAVKSVIKAMRYQYRDRKARKREFRQLWIIRINAACQENGIKYNRFIDGLNKANVVINRKLIADLAVNDAPAFKELVTIAKNGAATTAKAEKKTEKTGKK